MCGIAGIILKQGIANELDTALASMLSSQAHRGPDNTGKFIDQTNGVALGHNRLSIIDVSQSANQPFFSTNGRFALIFNGEIYNYLEIKKELEDQGSVFKTKSDTEVLVTAYEKWGAECLHRFNGMFSFALWDKERQELFAARDRFGVKPFFYSDTAETFLFASEIKALFASKYVSSIPCEHAWAGYLGFATYATPETTFWKGVQQLPGGHSLILKDGKFKVSRWYDFEERVSKVVIPKTYEAAREELWAKLQTSVALRLRSGVPIGLNLSGGIDSSVLYTLSSEHEGLAKRAFTFHCGDPEYDERQWVAEIVAHGSLPWSEVEVTSQEIPAFATKMQQIQDEPYAGIATLAYARVFQAARKSGVIVLLDGGGMDEHLAGYNYYGNSGQQLVQGTTQSPVRVECVDPEFIARYAEKPAFPEPFNDLTQNQQYRDLFITKLPRDLRFNDRMSMACSTELREPFLNHELVEFDFALPLEFKIRVGVRKAIVRDKLRSVLKSPLVEAPKRPVQTPQREWLRGPLKEWVRESVNSAVNNCAFLKKELVHKELERFFSGEFDNSFFVWQWITLGMMKDKF